MPITLSGIVFRLVKGSPITDAEGDNNLSLIQNFVNGLAAIIGVSLNPDGSLTANALSDPSQIGNKPLIADTLSANESLPAGILDTLNYQVTNAAVTAYAAGSRLKFIASANNPAAATVQWNPTATTPLAVVPILIGATVAIKANQILAGQVVEVEFDGTNFQLIQMVGLTAGLADISTGTDDVKPITSASLQATKFTSTLAAITGTGAIATFPHGFVVAGVGVVPFYMRWVLVCQTAEGGYAIGDEVGIEHFVAGISVATLETWIPQFVSISNTTDCILISQSLVASGGGGNVPGAGVTIRATDGSETYITLASWKARCYASL